jgi:hypothetical protein
MLAKYAIKFCAYFLAPTIIKLITMRYVFAKKIIGRIKTIALIAVAVFSGPAPGGREREIFFLTH